MNQKEIGTIIKERRKHLGVTQQTLADLAGVGINTLGLQVDLKIKNITYETV